MSALPSRLELAISQLAKKCDPGIIRGARDGLQPATLVDLQDCERITDNRRCGGFSRYVFNAVFVILLLSCF